MHAALVEPGEAHHRRVFVIRRFVLGADGQKQERSDRGCRGYGVDGHAVSFDKLSVIHLTDFGVPGADPAYWPPQPGGGGGAGGGGGGGGGAAGKVIGPRPGMSKMFGGGVVSGGG